MSESTQIRSRLFGWREHIAQSDLPTGTRTVAWALSLHMSALGDSCFPSIECLARETGMHRSTVMRHLETLVEQGWLDRTRRGKQGGRITNLYEATVPEGHKVAQDDSALGRTERSTKSQDATLPLPIKSDTESVPYGPVADAPCLDARGVAREWWEAVRARTGHAPSAPNFMALVKMTERALKAEHPAPTILAALLLLHQEARPITGQTLDEVLTHRERNGKPTAFARKRAGLRALAEQDDPVSSHNGRVLASSRAHSLPRGATNGDEPRDSRTT